MGTAPGHPRLRADRPVAGRPVRRAAARPAARVRARPGLRRGVRLHGRAGEGVLRAARRGRRAAVLDVAPGLGGARDRARWPTARRSWPPAAATSTPARARPRRSSPSRSPTLRVAGEGDLLAQMERLRRALHAEGLTEPQKRLAPPGAAAHDRRRDRRGRQGARRRAGRPAPPRLGRPRRLGVRAGAGPPRRAGDRPRAAGPRGLRGGRGDRRRARRRLARRPVRVLRRDAVPHRRAAARAGRSPRSATTPTAR